MEDRDDASSLLEQAASLIQRATGQLDTTQTECGHCGRVSSRHLSEWRAHRELVPVERKVREWAKKLAESHHDAMRHLST